eukprot:4200852-Pyramimonas_sp.AAC.1
MHTIAYPSSPTPSLPRSPPSHILILCDRTHGAREYVIKDVDFTFVDDEFTDHATETKVEMNTPVRRLL